MSLNKKYIDIIIPVYKGLNDTVNCINSLISTKKNNNTAFNIIVINDASPEPEVTEWLRSKAKAYSDLTLLENEQNLGFVGTVNRGMALSTENDVLLLNSDTVVSNDWLDRIHKAAYSAANIGSVTPFSTNATICSYPRFCMDNPLPDGMTVGDIDLLCAQTNPGMAVDVPTGVGFCMYIRRDCLNKVGLFDVETFGKGYGEENDFCQRAIKAGWRNIHLLDTFVLHTGGVSFGQSKSPREQAAMETLRRLHPRYEVDVASFVQQDPARAARRALDIARIQSKARKQPLLLHVVHNREGGTLRHVKELASFISTRASSLILSPQPQGYVSLQHASKLEEFELFFDVHSEFDRLIDFLKNLGVTHVHYHHVLGHAACIFDLPERLGTGYDFTVHDYYAFCLNISLTDDKGRFVENQEDGKCGCCKEDAISPMGIPLKDWRALNKTMLEKARFVLTPSLDVKTRMEKFAPAANIVAVYHPDLAQVSIAAVTAPVADKKLRVLVIGALSKIKGADVLEEVAIEARKRNVPVEFHLVGYGYRNLKKLPHANLIVHGAYEEEDLLGIVEQIDPHVAWFPCQWPETYSYTLSACLEKGLPVVSTDLGAIPERIVHRDWSWIRPWQSQSREWLELFEDIRTGKTQPSRPEAHKTMHTETAQCGRIFYAEKYLEELRHCVSTATPVSLKFIEQHCRRNNNQTLHMLVLKILIRLRSAPLLQQLSKVFPLSFQRKVKSWLLR